MRFDFLEPSYLLAVGAVLLGAFLSLGSDLGLQAPILLVGLARALHLSLGLATLRMCVIAMSRWRWTACWPDLALLAAAGLLASVVLAPLYFGIDQSMTALGVTTDDELLADPARWPAGIVEEWTHAAGPVLTVALLLGLPAWWARRTAPVAPSPPQADQPSPPAPMHGISCLQRLPPALGTDLVAARAELQYVRVYTTLGDALVLGALKDIASQRDAEGLLVHRAWWVCSRHVRTLRRKGDRYVLSLTNGLQVPVSRRRQKALISQFGSSTTLA